MKQLPRLLAVVLSVCLLAACAPQQRGRQGTANDLPAAQASQSAQSGQAKDDTQDAAPQAGGSLSVLLPAGYNELGTALQRVAALEGISLSVTLGDKTESYAAQAVTALSEEAAPDLFLVEEEQQASVIGTWIFEDLSGGDMLPATAALAGMAPQSSRLLDDSKVYGLPLGYNVQGYLVDIEMLAALLGTTNTAALLTDLIECSWEQWSQMLAALEIYLQRPTSMRVLLGSGEYIMPGYRPRIAQPLRGIFAFADGDADAITQGAIESAIYAPYDDAEAWQTAGEDVKMEYLFPTLESLYALMDFETLHMARPEGAVYRGESYIVREALRADEAQALFAEGTALLYRADTQTGLALEAENPRLANRLALVPIKMPPPVLLDEDELDELLDEEDEEQASSVLDEQAATEETAAAIAQRNTEYWYAPQGYLCVNAQSQNKAAAQNLLLRLFTTPEGVEELKALGHSPFSDLLPDSALATQMAGIINQGQKGTLLFDSSDALRSAGQSIGAHVATELMDKTEWGEDEAYDFLTGSLRAFGYRMTPGGFTPE